MGPQYVSDSSQGGMLSMYLGSKKDKYITIVLFLAPAVGIFLIFKLAPILISGYLSLLDWDILRPFSSAEFIGFENYRNWIVGGELFVMLKHTLTYMVLYIPWIIVLAVLEASVLNQELGGLKLYKICFYLPVVSSWVAGAIIWGFVLNGKYGYLNQWLSLIGIEGPNWLEDPFWAMPGVVLAALWKDTGFYALIVLSALKSVDKNYYEAATVDGAGAFTQFFKITIPLISPTLFLLIIFNVISGFQIFEPVFIMTDGGPANATTVVVERIYRYAFRIYKMGYASALTWILFLLILFVTLIQFRFEKKVNYDR